MGKSKAQRRTAAATCKRTGKLSKKIKKTHSRYSSAERKLIVQRIKRSQENKTQTIKKKSSKFFEHLTPITDLPLGVPAPKTMQTRTRLLQLINNPITKSMLRTIALAKTKNRAVILDIDGTLTEKNAWQCIKIQLWQEPLNFISRIANDYDMYLYSAAHIEHVTRMRIQIEKKTGVHIAAAFDSSYCYINRKYSGAFEVMYDEIVIVDDSPSVWGKKMASIVRVVPPEGHSDFFKKLLI